MTREELRARIRSEVERQGYAIVTAGEAWEALAAQGEDAAVSFDNALRGFAAFNGWEVRRYDPAPADAFAFYPAGQGPPLFEAPSGS
jgi:hypothetical protein